MAELKPWDRVAERIERIPESGCWIFTGATNSRGYGHIGVGGNRTVLVHRISYAHHHGDIPPGLMVCHICDVKCCVNPNHLYAGSHAENTRDALERQRMAFGVRNGNGRLTDSAVAAIKELLAVGESASRIAPIFGVTRGTVREIATGRRHA